MTRTIDQIGMIASYNSPNINSNGKYD